MKSLVFCFILFNFLSILTAQTDPEWEWAQGALGSGWDYGNAIAVDDSGNVYVTGSFHSDGYFGSTVLYSNGADDIFIAKLNSAGNWLWVVQAGGALDDCGCGIVLDENSNIYVSGYFALSVVFGPDTLTTHPDGDAFVAKLDTNGNWLWAVQVSSNNESVANDITIDSSGFIYLTIAYSFIADFGPFNLTSLGYSDVCVAKLDLNGNWIWAASAGGNNQDVGSSIEVDSGGNCYLTGYFTGNSYFGSTWLTGYGQRDIFVAKLNSSGNWLWASLAGSMGDDQGNGISVDIDGNCYVTGFFRYTAEFESFSLTANGSYDVFVAKLSSSGNWLWVSQAGGANSDYGYRIDAQCQNIIVTGIFASSASWGSNNLTSIGLYDVFVACMDTAGNWQWALSGGGGGEDYCYGLVADSSSCYIIGTFESSIALGNLTLDGLSFSDIFIAKVNIPIPPISLPFLEDWSSASLDTNFWTAESSHWQISGTLGNPAAAVVFQSEPGLMNYDSSLTSHEFDGTGMTSVKLKFDLDYSYTDWVGYNGLSVEIWNGAIWTSIGYYSYVNVYELTTVFMDISAYAVGTIFKIRFRAQGSDGSTFNYWMIDNIRLEEIPAQIDTPQNLTMTRSGNYVYLDWDPVSAADWYALYLAYSPNGPFYYGYWLDASITHLEGEITPDMDPMLFFRITAGAGNTPVWDDALNLSTDQLFKTVKVR